MARKPMAPSPPMQAIAKLAQLSGSGTSAARLDRAARSIVAEWRATADSDIARRWTETLFADVRAGLVDAEEQADDVDASDAGAVKQAGRLPWPAYGRPSGRWPAIWRECSRQF